METEPFNRNRRLIEDFTERTLAAISTTYGRLIYLSTLRDLATGTYAHSGLESVYPPAAVRETLSATHRAVFESVLQAPLEQQFSDLKGCLEAYDPDVGVLAERWSDVEFYRSLLPLGVRPAMKELFCSNIAALLSAIDMEHSTAAQAA